MISFQDVGAAVSRSALLEKSHKEQVRGIPQRLPLGLRKTDGHQIRAIETVGYQINGTQ